ncbi:MAG: Glyoxalase/bleomycin resistance protein/dioxygenase [Puniceicoccaceae bacterium 5H]|nr:MAG: Glyoxalase/bleomycin resistance protein/dioxygenase [Puniceicoccaceae bacterium 5H]
MSTSSSPSLVKRLAHVCLRTSDLAATRQFYCDVLGFTHVFDFFRKGEVVGFYFQVAEAQFIEVFYEDKIEADNGSHVLFHFCLECEDLKATRQKLLDAGYAPGEIIMPKDNTYQFWVKDPNGMGVEFQEYTKDSCQFTGQAVSMD